MPDPLITSTAGGPCGGPSRLINAYLPRMGAAAERDGTLAKSLTLVFGLKNQPQGLLRPDRMLRVLLGNLRTP
jgi:hypothetical protein